MADMTWMEKDPVGFALGLKGMEQTRDDRYGAKMQRGVDLFEGQHWTNQEVESVKKALSGQIEELPIRNLHRQKIRHTAFVMTPGMPGWQFHIRAAMDGDELDDRTEQGIQRLLTDGIRQIMRRSEYLYEAARAIIDFENQYVAWMALIPVDDPKRLEFMHIPTRKMIFDVGVQRLRHMKWGAWVDAVSPNHMRAVWGEDKMKGVEALPDEFTVVKNMRTQVSYGEALVSVIHMFAQKGATIPVRVGEKWQDSEYRVIDKPTHLIMVGNKVVHIDNKLPIDQDDKPILPFRHVILEADPNDILGKALAETGDQAQRQINRIQLAMMVKYMHGWKQKWIHTGADSQLIDDLNDPTLGHVAANRYVKSQEITGPLVTQQDIAAMEDAIYSYETQTGNYSSAEGAAPNRVTAAAGIMHLSQMARTPIFSRARLFAETIRYMGEVFVGWKRVWGDGMVEGDNGKKVDILKLVDVEIDLDTILELTKEETYNRLLQLAEVTGIVDPELIIEQAPIGGVVKEKLQRAARRQMEAQAEQARMMQASMAGGGEGEGGGVPMMEGAAGLPPGVTAGA